MIFESSQLLTALFEWLTKQKFGEDIEEIVRQ